MGLLSAKLVSTEHREHLDNLLSQQSWLLSDPLTC